MTQIIALTRAEVKALKPCSLDKLKVFGRHERMNARQALEAGASIEDLLWVAGQLGLKRQIVRFALACARRVAHLNTDLRVQAALDAAQAWLDNPGGAAARAADDAADAAWAAADAAWDAWAAADAAWDARAAARAAVSASAAARAADDAADAAWAAAAAARAASAAADAAWDAEKEAQCAIFLKIFCPEEVGQ